MFHVIFHEMYKTTFNVTFFPMKKTPFWKLTASKSLFKSVTHNILLSFPVPPAQQNTLNIKHNLQ